MMKVGIIGYGQLGKHIERQIAGIVGVGAADFFYFDDIAFNQGIINAFRFNDYMKSDFRELYFTVALGYKHLKTKELIINKLKDSGRKLYSFIHPTSILASDASIGGSVFIFPGCIIDNNVRIEDGCLLHNGVIVSHDTKIGSCCYLSPGVILCGNVALGERNFLGANGTVTNGCVLGSDCVIGIGSVITKNLNDKTIGTGNPFEEKKSINLL